MASSKSWMPKARFPRALYELSTVATACLFFLDIVSTENRVPRGPATPRHAAFKTVRLPPWSGPQGLCTSPAGKCTKQRVQSEFESRGVMNLTCPALPGLCHFLHLFAKPLCISKSITVPDLEVRAFRPCTFLRRVPV